MGLVKKVIHPLGELISNEKHSPPLDTYAGKIHVKWEPEASVTMLGMFGYFAEFLKLGQRFEPFVEDCPLTYESNNAPTKQDVLGTLLLSVLSGHNRYAHMGGLRHDGVNGKLLGMSKIVSDDSARRALCKIDETESRAWLETHLQASYLPLLETPWILDLDATIKPIYGHQEGAVIGYNPKKPGRPSHVYQTYLIANLRLVLDTEVLPGNENHSQHALPGLMKILSALPKECRPYLVRGDCDFGNERLMSALEAVQQDYLFKLRKSANVKQLISEHHNKSGWKRFKRGWEVKSSTLELLGWSRHRRVVLVRRRLEGNPVDNVVLEYEQSGQLSLGFIVGPENMKAYEYSVLVTSLEEVDNQTLLQHYRDRADAENYFDEIKNQWGWSGYTTTDLKRCNLMAKFIALVYNWWTLFVRCYEPSKHTEARTARPMLLSSVGKLTVTGRQQTLTITNTHENAAQVQSKFTQLGTFFNQIRLTARQLSAKQVWKRLLEYALRAFSLKGFSPPIFLGFSP